jgi:acetate kinase
VSGADGRRVLTVNAGSTSLKLAVVEPDGSATSYEALDEALAGPSPDAVAHRVVHGGERRTSVVVDDAVVEELRGLTALAPLHQPPALEALAAVRGALPDVPHVACFDTAFHATVPAAATTYALPERLRHKVRSYGFHGLSHAWASAQVRDRVPGARRVLVAHLGGGASLCAVLDGASVATTMGFTPMDGLVMATRTGRIDPGAVLWLAENTDEDLPRVLARESGLLGLAGTADMREVLSRRGAGDPEATLALDVYLHRFAAEAAGMAAALAGLDVVVLTGGVGEGGPLVQSLLVERLAWLGVRMDEHAPGSDEGGVQDVTAEGSTARVLVVHAREDLQMVREVAAALG